MGTPMEELIGRVPGPLPAQWMMDERLVTKMQQVAFKVELYAPRGRDRHVSHSHDALYFIMQGKGEFEMEQERYTCTCGDAFFVAAGVRHRFENFSDDFATWVVYWGPNGGAQ